MGWEKIIEYFLSAAFIGIVYVLRIFYGMLCSNKDEISSLKEEKAGMKVEIEHLKQKVFKK